MGSLARGAARAGRILREVLLTLAALGGAACIVLVILAFTGGYSLIMFKTGSMSPTIPAGSVALVQEVPAGEVAVGDIVTVDRPAALPITHRVTDVIDGASPEERVITMRGDANEAEDPLPYTITDARIVRGSVPYLAHAIVWFGNPMVLGGITIAAAILVTWAFWPRERPPRRRQARARPMTAVPVADHADMPPAHAPQTRRERRLAGMLSVAALLGMLSAGLGQTPSAVAASATVTMRSDLPDTVVQRLDAVEPVHWHVDVDASATPDDGDLRIEVSGFGDRALVLSAEIRSCAVPWRGERCRQGERMLREGAPVTLDGSWEELLRTATPKVSHLRLALTAEVADEPSAAASLTVRATAQGESTEETINGSGQLPQTGGQAWSILAAPAAVLVGLGVALIARAGRRRARTRMIEVDR